MNLELTGLFKAKTDYKQITDKFGVQNFYLDVDTDTDFPSVVEFQVNNNKIDLEPFKVGQKMTVKFNINGRKWEKDGRSGFAQNLTAWRIEAEQGDAIPEQAKKDDDNDLPF